ncbi:MAG: hypothetical protein EGP73_11375 [Alistipes indistinctus]|uniref:DUF6047 family protein n=1 Tax=Alistipes indistinctus TaxID=626932 RepID=UPI00241CED99|nr:DUF6047 family protein [Alistipes indistinctus]MBD9134830.1 hypothetical protein [Alistipes indistinctus]MBD9135439.1 hypothetical protein [Alistipes indistinctus]
MAKLTDRIKKAFRDFWNSIPMSVYVALDASGEAVEMKGGDGQYSSPNKTDRGQTGYKAFVKHLVKRYGGSDYIPDFNIRRFDFPNQWKVPVFGKDTKHYYRNKLLSAAEKQNVAPSQPISLRDAVYIIKSGLPLFDPSTEHGKLTRRKDYKEFIAHNEQGRWKEFMQGKENRYTAVATDQGVMLFSQTRMGEKALHTYLQECAGNFFNPTRSTETLKIYEVVNPTADVAAKADNYIERVSRRDERSDSPGLFYSKHGTTPEKMLSPEILAGAVCTEKYDMRPDFHNFDRFTGDNTLRTDRESYEIATLLYISENGFANHLAADYFHPFSHMDDFKPLADKINDTMQAKGENQKSDHDFGYAALQKEAKSLAGDILESQYHIRDGEFALGQTRSNIIPLNRTVEQEHKPKIVEMAAERKRPVMKQPASAPKKAPRRVPAMKPAPKGPVIS